MACNSDDGVYIYLDSMETFEMSYLEQYQDFVADNIVVKQPFEQAWAELHYLVGVKEYDKKHEITPEFKREVVKHLGHVLFEIANICNILEVSMDRPIIENRDGLIALQNKMAMQ